MTIQRKDIAQISKDLESASLADVPGAANQVLSNRQTIRELAPVLLKKKKEGFTTDALVRMLKNKNVHIKSTTLNRYLKEWQVDNKKTRPKSTTVTATDATQKKSAPLSRPETPIVGGGSDTDTLIQDKGGNNAGY